MSKKMDEIKLNETENEATVDENVEVNNEEQAETPHYEYGSYGWALDMLIKGVNVAQSYGVYTLRDAALLQTAIDVVNNTSITVNAVE